MDDNDWKNTRNGTFCFHRMMIDTGVNENESKKEIKKKGYEEK